MPDLRQKLCNGFAGRLSEALSYAGLDQSPTSLARHFNRHANDQSITMHGARRWLLGESMPTQGHLRALGKSLGVSPDWLMLGQGPMSDGVSSAPRLAAGEAELVARFQSLGDAERDTVLRLMRLLSERRQGA